MTNKLMNNLIYNFSFTFFFLFVLTISGCTLKAKRKKRAAFSVEKQKDRPWPINTEVQNYLERIRLPLSQEDYYFEEENLSLFALPPILEKVIFILAKENPSITPLKNSLAITMTISKNASVMCLLSNRLGRLHLFYNQKVSLYKKQKGYFSRLSHDQLLTERGNRLLKEEFVFAHSDGKIEQFLIFQIHSQNRFSPSFILCFQPSLKNKQTILKNMYEFEKFLISPQL